MSHALLDHLWQSTLFGLAIWAGTLLLRRNSAAVRHWMWLLASVKFLLPFSLLHALGASAGVPESIEVRPGYFLALSSAEPVVSPASLVADRVAMTSLSGAMAMALTMGAWLLGAAWLALRWLQGWRLANQLSNAPAAANAPPDVQVVDADIEPSVARVFRPVVLLPAALPDKLSAPQLGAVLEHEREHIVRRDNLKAHLHRLVETLFWFHPLVWFIGRRLVDERERACDEAVLARGHDAGEYVAGILAVCRHCSSHSPHAIAAVSGDLGARVRCILRSARPVSLGFLKAFALTTCSLLLAAVPLAAGALDGSVHRREVAQANSRLLLDSQLAMRETAGGAAPMSLDVSAARLRIHDSSLRELIALAYQADTWSVKDWGVWLDSPRYDIDIALSQPLREADDFDAAALRPLVNQLLAARFNLEIHVNQQCQDPCGPRALRVAARR